MNDQNPGTDQPEPEILEAYRGLSAPTSPPDDLIARVEGGIRRRRVVRRSVVGVAALAVVGGLGAQALADDPDTTTVTDQPFAAGPAPTSTLTFTHTDGSTHTFAADDLGILCEPSDDGGETLILTRRDVIADVKADREPSEEALASGPLLYVELQLGQVDPGQVFSLPYDSTSGASEDRIMTFFFATDEGRKRANEVSSAEPGASGTVIVNEASCGANPTLSVDIAGTLGSEVEQQALAIEGSYRS